MATTGVFEKLWKDYEKQNPSVKKIASLFHQKGENIINDHIAFRTFDDPRVSVDILAKPFLALGYKEAGSYHFPEKNLFAKHFEREDVLHAPRVFISQLIVSRFSEFLKKTIAEILDIIPEEKLNPQTLAFSGNVFGEPEYAVYQNLRNESEYAAWLYVFGFRANHFTVSVNDLKNYSSLEEVNELLKQNGFELNKSGGEIKGSRDKYLKQSSTLADIIPVRFKEGVHTIPACYYEFAERFKDSTGKLFSGFIPGSANKIFESTDFRK